MFMVAPLTGLLVEPYEILWVEIIVPVTPTVGGTCWSIRNMVQSGFALF